MPIENSCGRLFDITHALGEAGINLRALNPVDSGFSGALVGNKPVFTTRPNPDHYEANFRIDLTILKLAS